MKKIFTSLLLLFALFASPLAAQCPNDNVFVADIAVPNEGDAANIQLFQGEYITVYVRNGHFYRFSTCGNNNFDTHITLYEDNGSTSDLGDDGEGCTTGDDASFVWRADFSGTIRVLLDHRKCNHSGGLGVDTDREAVVLVEHLAPPVNDLCQNATPVATGLNCLPTFGTVLASSTNSSTCTGYTRGDVWYQFTASSVNMEINVDANGNFNPIIELYAGNDCNSLQLISCDNSSSNGDELLAVGGLTVGRRYYVRVYSRTKTTSTDFFPDDPTFNICVVDIPPPANDNCATATDLPHHWRTQCGATLGNTRGATPTAAALPACSGNADDDVWYTFEARYHTALIQVESAEDFAFQVFADDCTTSIACQNSNSAIGGSTESLTLTGLQVGTRYRVRVYTVGTLPPSGNTFGICVTVPPPANDMCSNAIELQQRDDCFYYEGTIFGATPSNPTIAAVQCSGDGDDDVWFTFRPTNSSARIRLQTFDDFDGVAQIMFDCRQYHRDCINDLDGSGIEDRLLTNLTVGREYYVRVYSFGSTRPQSSGFNLCITQETPTSIEENSLSSDLWRLFPNPTSDVLHLHRIDAAAASTAQWTIRDLTGRSLMHGSTNVQTGDNQWTFPVGELPTGIYLLDWQEQANGTRQTWKWVKL